ncbi:MAG: glycine C-acetyltransferase [Nitrososphaerota archaeon]|nr:glycine C-acetyltransferase [Nitrososphaerota archaeon]
MDQHIATHEQAIDFMARELSSMKVAGLDWKPHVLEGPSQPRTRVDGKDVIVLCSNNYLGLANHPSLRKAAIDALNQYGSGSGSVRVIAGTMKIHQDLESELASFKGAEDSIVFQSGFVTNSGCIQQLVDENDLIVSDELNHGSIIDGCRLTRSERVVYKHKDVGDLERILRTSDKYRRILVITDGVFSMDGDIAPLDEIVRVAKSYNAMVYVDDAHGDGVLGENGKGIVNHFHLEGKVDFEMGTFSKAFGVVGGYVVGSRTMKEYFYNKVRTFLLSGSHPPAVAASCLAALRLVSSDKSIVERLWANTRYFKKALKDLGFDTGESETPITPIMVGEGSIAQDFAKESFNQGVFVLPIVYPMVAKGKARIRTIVTSAHSKQDLDDALGAFEKVGKKLSII